MRTGLTSRSSRAMRAAVAAVSLCCLATAGETTQPRQWLQSAFADLAAGTPSAVAIGDEGDLSLGPDLQEIADLRVQRIWSLIDGPEGRVYAGTGDEGKVICLDRIGTELWSFDSPETGIHALLLGPDGQLYAGTAPDGLIYRIDPETGEAQTLAQTRAHYIWDLQVGPRGRIWAATGEPGQVLSIDPDGAASVLFQAPEQHVMCLARHGKEVLAGTAGEARIYALAASGDSASVRLLFSAPQMEIHDLAVLPNGTVLASALPGSEEGDGDRAPLALYSVAVDGAVRQLWQSDKAKTLSMTADPQSRAYLVTDAPARLTRWDPSGREQILLDLDDMTVAAMHTGADDGILLGAAQSGRIVAVGPGRAAEGEFVSAVEDFGAHCRWGRISWDAETPQHAGIEVSTRSGNSAEPDATWSIWSPPVKSSGETVVSPPARYLQYRVRLDGRPADPGPVLHRVAVIGQQTNLPPSITKLEVAPYRTHKRQSNGVQDPAQAAIQNAAERRRPPQARSLFLLQWQASDPNGDDLTYRLYLRGAGQESWKLAEEDVRQTSLLWDTFTMPEGFTQLLLIASDAADNPPGEALEARRLSQPFALDNSPPRINLEATREGQRLRVKAHIEDRITALTGAEFSVDYHSEAARQIPPLDGLFDSLEEQAEFLVEELAPGEHVIVVRAWDQLENVGAAQIVVRTE